MCRSFLALIFLTTLLGTTEAADEGVYLRYVLPDAKQLLYDVKVSSSIKTLGAKLQQEWKSREKVASEGDGSQRITVTMEDMIESEPASGRILRRDILSKLVGNELSFRLTELGDISELGVEGIDRFPSRDRQVAQVILVQLRQLYAAVFPKVPAGPVDEGWEATRNLKVMDGATDLDDTYISTFKVKKQKKKDGRLCLEIKEHTQIETKGYMCFGQGPESQLLSYRTVGTGVREGSFLFDTERGLILEYEGESKLTLKFGLIGQPANAMQESEARTKFKRKLKSVKDL